MTAWCMAHPWMTFVIAIVAIDDVYCVIVNWRSRVSPPR